MLTVLSFSLEAAISAVPFPSKSATATKNGNEPTAIGEPAGLGEGAVSIAQQNTDRIVLGIGYCQILNAVPIEISDLYRFGKIAHGDGGAVGRRERAISMAQQNNHCIVVATGGYQVSIAVMVKISHREGAIRSLVGIDTRRGAHFKNCCCPG